MVWQLLAVARFVGAAFLGPGSALAFAAVCVATGATLGADMVILPAMFSVALTQAGLSASQAFGLWSFAGKLGLSLTAFLILPVLQTFGFTPGAQNTDAALRTLTVAYAVLPCVLKLCVLAIVLALPLRTGA